MGVRALAERFRPQGRTGFGRSLAAKLLLRVGAAVLLAGIVAAALVLTAEARRYLDSKRAELVAAAQVFAAAAAPAVQADDRRAAFEALRGMRAFPHIRHVRVEKDGRVLAAFGTAPQLDADLRLDGDERPSVMAVLTSRTLEVRVAVRGGGVDIGELSLIASTDDMADRLKEALVPTLFGIAITLTVALLLAGGLQQGLVQRLSAVTAVLRRVRDKEDYSERVRTPRIDDEVGQLVDGVNGMLAAVRERDDRLAAHLRGLEDEVKARTRDLAAARDAAEAASAAKSQFLATMSHEIRTPLNGILVMADLLARGDLGPRDKRYAEIVARSGHNLLAIIDDILDVSKIEAGKLVIETTRFAPRRLIDDVMSLFAARAGAKGLDLAGMVAPEVPAELDGDPARLAQIIGNLVGNALKFTEAGHVLVRVTRERSGATVVEVEDTGIGIPADKLASVFEAFTQADQSTTRRFGGTGLGLTISRRLAEAMGGSITVTSREGHGTTFRLTVPLAGETAAAEPAPERGTVAVIAPGAATRTALAALLEAEGFRVTTAGTVPADHAALVAVFAPASAFADLALPPATRRIGLAAFGDETAEAAAGAGRLDAVAALPVLGEEISRLARRLAAGESLTETRSAAAAPAAMGASLAGLVVLVADDDPVNREVATAALTPLGATIVTATDGFEAFEAARGAIDAVLMDASMPRMDGFAAARAIRTEERETGRRRVPIIALTAHVAGTAAEAWREAGMDGLVLKPFAIDRLVVALRDAVGSDRLAEAAARPAAVPAPAAAPLAVPAPAAPPAVADDTSPPADGPPLLDRSRLDDLAAMAAGRPEVVARVIALFAAHAPGALERLATAMAGSDLEAVGAAAHALKSMSGNVGAVAVQKAAAALEEEARAQGRMPAARKLDEMRDLFARTLKALDTPTAEAPPAPASPAPAPAAPAPAATPALPAEPVPPKAVFPSDDQALLDDLALAIDADALDLHYQPIYDRAGSTMVGVEALVRWNHPTRGFVPPGRFVPLAERAGLITRIDSFVLGRALDDIPRLEGLTVAVNVSPVDIKPGFAARVESELKRRGLAPQRLDIEITETMVLDGGQTAQTEIEHLAALGVGIALDDFGTGYSSLTHLRRVPLTKIKIDRSFVQSLDTQIESAAIVQAVIALGRALGKKIVAEGVETEAQHRFLSVAGCAMMQGWHFGKAMPIEKVIAELQRRRNAA